MKISLSILNGNFIEENLLFIRQLNLEVKKLEAKDFSTVYEEIADAAGTDVAVIIHQLFKGQQILFPQKLYKKSYIYEYIKTNYNGRNVRELSQKFGYSDRRIRQIIADLSIKK